MGLHSASLLSPSYLPLPCQPLVDCSICSSHDALLLHLHHNVINIFCSCCQLLANDLFSTHHYLLISLHHVWTLSYSLSFSTTTCRLPSNLVLLVIIFLFHLPSFTNFPSHTICPFNLHSFNLICQLPHPFPCLQGLLLVLLPHVTVVYL